MADWEDAALNNRHLHNRVGKQGRGKNGRANGAFNVQKAFGTYELKISGCAPAKLEIYTLNAMQNALLGELIVPDRLHASVLLAGSRRVMETVVHDYESDAAESPEAAVLREADAGEEGSSGFDNRRETERSGSEEDSIAIRDGTKFAAFEKNSFRSPKFWLRWQGSVMQLGHEQLDTDSGYFVFSSNNCDQFQGTVSCSKLEWKNKKVNGRKISSKPARDFDLRWRKASSTSRD